MVPHFTVLPETDLRALIASSGARKLNLQRTVRIHLFVQSWVTPLRPSTGIRREFSRQVVGT
jgi:hypothetical protein